MSVTMALDARHRSSIYLEFVPLIGEDDANALMPEFPASDADELVTKQFLRAELAEFQTRLTWKLVRALGVSVGSSTTVLALLIAIQ
jgi:hypothetical protein